ncbi:hypothetical protein V6N13_001635 [Hibiscus sabdariffa]
MGMWFDSFIAGKRNRAGKRFGFVRFPNRQDAERAIERLNGFNLYGSRLSVSVARYRARTTYWRKVRQDKFHQKQEERMEEVRLRKPEESQNNSKSLESMEGTSNSELKWGEEKRLRRVQGFLEEEALVRLNKCAVGTMAAVCSISSVEQRL